MKILLICGSPRKRGNTAQILRRLAVALEGETVTMVSLADLHLNGCLGCSACQGDLEKPGCVQQDDVTALLQQVMEADAVVYGMPLYGHSYSGQLKLLMDRHVALVVSCQGPEEQNTELVAMQFEKFCESSLAGNLGTCVFPWCAPNVKGSNYSQETLQWLADRIRNTGS